MTKKVMGQLRFLGGFSGHRSRWVVCGAQGCRPDFTQVAQAPPSEKEVR